MTKVPQSACPTLPCITSMLVAALQTTQYVPKVLLKGTQAHDTKTGRTASSSSSLPSSSLATPLPVASAARRTPPPAPLSLQHGLPSREQGRQPRPGAVCVQQRKPRPRPRPRSPCPDPMPNTACRAPPPNSLPEQTPVPAAQATGRRHHGRALRGCLRGCQRSHLAASA